VSGLLAIELSEAELLVLMSYLLEDVTNLNTTNQKPPKATSGLELERLGLNSSLTNITRA